MTDKVTIERETLQKAIDALECSLSDSRPYIVKSRESAAALRAALEVQPAEPVPQWQPIETAPKDELILVGPTKRMGICAAMHHSRDGWVTETTSEWVTMYPPTQWMPLPPEPKDAA